MYPRKKTSHVPLHFLPLVAAVLVAPPNSDAANLSVNIPVTAIAGDFLLNGDAPPASVYQTGLIYLTNPETADRVDLGFTHTGDYQSNLIPGTYKIHYEHHDGQMLPVNGNAYLGDLVVPEPSEVVSFFDINIQAVPLFGSVQFNGNKPPKSIYQHGQLSLVDPGTGDEIPWGKTYQTPFDPQLVVPGNYDVYYSHIDGQKMAQNQRALIDSIEVTPVIRPELHFAASETRVFAAVPEPSGACLSAALISLLGVRRRRSRQLEI